MRIHIFQHVSFEGPGAMEAWFSLHHASVSVTRWFEDPGLPDLGSVDLLVIMGGPMSVHDETAYPWLRTEKLAIRQALTRGIPLLGVCLGAQLIADVLGARVYRNPQKEIGWFPVESSELPDLWQGFRFPPSLEVLHWHGETFDIPVGARRLARSSACRNQAFQYGDRTIGLQFHLETTPESLTRLVQGCRHELTNEANVQPESVLFQSDAERTRSLHACMDRLLGYLTRCPAGVPGALA